MSISTSIQQQVLKSKSQDFKIPKPTHYVPEAQLIEPETPSFKIMNNRINKTGGGKADAKSLYGQKGSKVEQSGLKKSLDQSYRINVVSTNGLKPKQGLVYELDDDCSRIQKQHSTSLNLSQQFPSSKALDTSIVARITHNKTMSVTNHLLSTPMLESLDISKEVPTESKPTAENAQKSKKNYHSTVLLKQQHFQNHTKKSSNQFLLQRIIQTQHKQQHQIRHQRSEKILMKPPALRQTIKNNDSIEQRKNKTNKMIKSIIDLQVSLQMTLNILQTHGYESEAITNLAKLGRMQTIINAKMAVDANQLFKLASQLKE